MSKHMWTRFVFPWLRLVQYAAYVTCFYYAGRAFQMMDDIPVWFVYILWGLGSCLIVPIMLLQWVVLRADRGHGILTIKWQSLAGVAKEVHSYPLDAIRAVILYETSRTYRGEDLSGDEEIVVNWSRRDWSLVLDLVDDDERPILPIGQTPGLVARAIGRELAEALGVPCGKRALELTD